MSETVLSFEKERLVGMLRQSGLLVFFALLVVILAILRPEFLSPVNIRNILQSGAIVGVLACGQTVVMLTGGFDLSVAKNAVVVGLLAAILAKSMGPVGVLIALALGALVGALNGFLIAKGKVNPFVVTLGTYTVLGSAALLMNGGQSESDIPAWFRDLTQWNLFSLSALVFWFALVCLVVHTVLAYTKFGRHIYAVGGNYEASRLSGVRSDRVLISAYVISGLAAGIAGVLLTSRLGSANPAALPGLELDAIAAVIIGGTRLSGGFGSISRTIMGVLILQSLSAALVILQVDTYWQGVLKGAIIIIAVMVDVAFSRRR